jgi:diacylglycerol kinase
MDYTHSDIAVQARPSALLNVWNGLKKVFVSDPGLMLQMGLATIVVAAGVVLHLNAVQWVLISIVTLLFLMAGIMRTASLLQIRHDESMPAFQASRIRFMGNAIVAVTSGLTLMTYLLVFVPRLSQLA